MKLSLTTTIPRYPFSLNFEDKMLLLGSCFSENIGELMENSGFFVCSNPTGILFNPISMAETFAYISGQAEEVSVHPVERDGKWCSLYQHSELSGKDVAQLHSKIQYQLQQARSFYYEAACMVLTFGTAHVWTLKESGRVVANCQKQPASMFEKRLLSNEEILAAWIPLIEAAGTKRIFLTVSPVRHSRDGLHGNNLSKATLQLAVNDLLLRFPNKCFYFPSYELVLDELRDYRFFKEDMVHPSDQAVRYVWKKWCEALYGEAVRSDMKAYQALRQRLLHQPRFEDEAEEMDYWVNLDVEVMGFETVYRKMNMQPLKQLLPDMGPC
jgi:hypothetical protein